MNSVKTIRLHIINNNTAAKIQKKIANHYNEMRINIKNTNISHSDMQDFATFAIKRVV